MVVLMFADYAAPYEGNFISSLKHSENSIEAVGGNVIYVFPENAGQTDWARLAACRGNVFFLKKSTLQSILLFIKLIRRFKVDIIHSHFSVFKYDLMIKTAAFFARGTKYVRHMHMLYKNKDSRLLELVKRTVCSADCHVACSIPVYNSMKAAGLKNIETVINAIDFERLAVRDTPDKEGFARNPGDKLILILGYEYEIKGVDIAVRAVKLLNEKGIKATLLICAAVGSRIIADRITRDFGVFPDFVRIIPPREDIAAYYALCDVFVSPSREESFCYALREAGYCGVPLVASDIEAHSVPGAMLFKRGDAGDLAEKLCYTLTNDNTERINLQIKSIIESCSMENWCEILLKIYKKLLT